MMENVHRGVPSIISVLSVDPPCQMPSAAVSSARQFFFPPLLKLVVTVIDHRLSFATPGSGTLSSLQCFRPVQDLATLQGFVAPQHPVARLSIPIR
jgi:hypothetical protein